MDLRIEEYPFSRSYWRATIFVASLFPCPKEFHPPSRNKHTWISAWIFRKIGKGKRYGEGRIDRKQNFEASSLSWPASGNAKAKEKRVDGFQVSNAISGISASDAFNTGIKRFCRWTGKRKERKKRKKERRKRNCNLNVSRKRKLRDQRQRYARNREERRDGKRKIDYRITNCLSNHSMCVYIYIRSTHLCIHVCTLSVSNVYVDIHTYLLRLHSTRRTVIDHFSQSTRAMLLKPEQ